MTTPRRLAAALAAAALALSAQVAPDARTGTVEAAPAVEVTVSCSSNPETVRVRNNKGSAITLKSVGSIHEPREEEPYAVTRKLAAGKTVVFASGSKAAANNRRLTKKFIFDNSVGDDEGARVRTSAGTFTDRCDA